MTTFELKNIFAELSSEADKLAEEFLLLSYNQINWKPDESQWSIGECIEHLLRSNIKYIPAFEVNLLQGKENRQLEFKQSLPGRLLLKSVMPDNKKKFKTSPSFNPAGSELSKSIVKDFIDQNKLIKELAEEIDSANLSKKISSPFIKFIRYSIGDSLLIIGNHNIRHLLQAKRVMQNESFPAA